MNRGLSLLLRAEFGIETDSEMERILSDPEMLLAMLDVAEIATQHSHGPITSTSSV